MKLTLTKGQTSQRLAIFIQDSSSTTGAGLTGLAYNTGSLVAYYWREDQGNAGATAITLATATRGTFTSGGFVEKDATNMPGFYELGIPDAALATGAKWVTVMLKGASNMAPLALEIELVSVDLQDAVRLGLASLLNLAVTTGTVTTDAGNSATSFETDLAQTTNDHWKDAYLLITSSALVNQIKRVTAYNGTTKIITVSGGFTGTPADGVSFALINR